jgi:hypothetical protein
MTAAALTAASAVPHAADGASLCETATAAILTVAAPTAAPAAVRRTRAAAKKEGTAAAVVSAGAVTSPSLPAAPALPAKWKRWRLQPDNSSGSLGGPARYPAAGGRRRYFCVLGLGVPATPTLAFARAHTAVTTR